MSKTITTLSPLHIGNGATLQISDYTIADGCYIRIDVGKAFALVSRYGKGPDVLCELEKLLDEFSGVDDCGTQVRIRQELDFLQLCSRVDPELKAEIAEHLDTITLYKIPSFLQSQISSRLVDEQLKDAERQVYIPGSTIKGALRTALLTHVIQQLTKSEKESVINYIRSQIEGKSVGRNSRLMKTLDDRLIDLAFNCGKKNRNSSNVFFKDVKYDLMRFLVVQDSSALAAAESLGVMYPKQFALSSIETGQGSRNPCEVILPAVSFSFELNILIEQLFLLGSKINFAYHGNPGIRDMQGNIVWIDIKRKVRRLFNLDLNAINQNKINEYRDAVVDHVLSCCRKFYKEVLWHDRNWLEHAKARGGSGAVFEYMDHFYELLDDLIQHGVAVIKTGAGAGFHAKTAMLMMLLDDTPENSCLKDTMITLIKQFEIGKPPDHRGAYNLNTDTFPASRPLIVKDFVLDSFGWVMLQHQPLTVEQKYLLDRFRESCIDQVLVRN